MISHLFKDLAKGILCDMSATAYRTFAFSLLLLMFSCNENEGDGAGPVISLIDENGLISSDTIISPGQFMNFGVDASMGDFDITQFLIRVKGETVQNWFDTGMYTPHLIWYGSYAKSYNDNETWEFIVRDRYGHEQITSILIGIDSINDPGSIDQFENIIMGAQNNNDHGGFIELFEAQLFFQEEARQNQEIIDLIYYLGEDEHTMGSPGANIEDGIFSPEYTPTTWEYRNTTRYIPVDMNPEEFEMIENDSILLVSYIEGEGKRKAKNLQTDNVFSFKTQDLRFGIMKINEVTGTAEGTVSIDIKIQKRD